MIKARIRWCTCRVENILTLGKLLSLWFCFLFHSILFLISQTFYCTYKIISSYELARPIMGTIFLVVCLLWSKKRRRYYVGQTPTCSKSVVGGKILPVTPVLFISTLYARAALAWTEEKRSLKTEKLKANRAS